MAAKKLKGKARGKKSSSSKISISKLSNKRLNKLAKQGKLKDRVKKSQYLRLLRERTQGPVDPERAEQLRKEEQEEVPDIPLAEADYEYFSTPGRDFSFITDVSEGEENAPKKRSKKNKTTPTNDALETNYEAISRKRGPLVETKALLPLKTRDGLIPQVVEVTHSEDEEESEKEESEVEEETPQRKPLPTLRPADLLLMRERKLSQLKHEIGLLASAVVENPEENTRKLRELRAMLNCEDPDVFLTVKKITVISLTEVFKDIIPDYRIRISSEKEKQQSATKETRKTRDFEETLLNNYKNFLEFLEVLVKGKAPKGSVHKKRRKKVTSALVPPEALKPMRKLGLQSLCDLLSSHTHFNFRTNIIATVVPYMNSKDEEIRTIVCNYIKKIFKEDRYGEVTLEIIRLIGRVTKACSFDVQPSMLASFLALKIKEVDRTPQDNKKTRKEKFAKMSRRERKRKKQMEHLEKELEDAAASEKADQRLRLNTEIINMIFLTYFRILKMGADSNLLSVVLEGLAKFAHLINVDFFDDLFSVLNQLVDTGDLTYRESLYCVQTAFKILSGQGSTLNIDPMRFYRHLYTTLLDLNAGVSSEDFPIALESLDLMINKRRKQVSLKRLLAFTKRMITTALHMTSNGCVAALAMARIFLRADNKMDLLYDTDTLGNGLFMPELEDPEHCNAGNTSIYELHMLKKYYHPTVRQYASHLLAGAPTTGAGQLPMEMSNKSPVDLHDEFDASGMKFNPSIPPKPRNKKKLTHDGFIQKDLTELEQEVLDSVKNFKIVKFSSGKEREKHRKNGVCQNGKISNSLKRKHPLNSSGKKKVKLQ